MIILTVALCFLIIIGIALEFEDFEGGYAAFASNLMMSVMFISLLINVLSTGMIIFDIIYIVLIYRMYLSVHTLDKLYGRPRN